jgi:predicted ester cyclase
MSVDENKTCVLRQFEELWNNGQIDRVEDFFAQDFMNFGQQYQDARSIVKHIVQVWRTAFPDLRFTVDFIVAEGDLVMCEASFEGTHLGEFPLIPPLQGPTLDPNGKTFKVKHIHRFRLKEGKIIEHFAVRDDLGMFQQLGHLGALSGRRKPRERSCEARTDL